MSPTQTLIQTDLFTELKKIISSGTPWDKLSKSQKILFANPLLLASLNVSSNIEAFNLLSSQPEILEPSIETGSTVDAALLEDLVNQLNESNLETELKTSFSSYSLDQQELIKRLIDIRIKEIQAETLLKNKQAQTALKELKPEIDKQDTKKNPRQDLVITAKSIVESSINSSSIPFTKEQKNTAINRFINTAITQENLDLSNSQDLSPIIATSLVTANPKYASVSPIAKLYLDISQAVSPATDKDYQEAIRDQQPTTPSDSSVQQKTIKIVDSQAGVVIDLSKIPSPKKIDTQIVSIPKSTQQEVNNILKKSVSKDITDYTTPLENSLNKLKRETSSNQKARKISQDLIVQISNEQIGKIIQAVNKNPTILRLPTLLARKAARIIEQTHLNNPNLSREAVEAYSQGLRSETLGGVYENSKELQRKVSPRQIHNFQQQLKTLDNSKLGKEITQPLTGLARRFQTFTNKITSKLPQSFTKPLNFILHPIQSIKGWLGEQIGKRLGVKIYKAFAKKTKNKTARLIAKTLLRQGIKKGVKTLVNLGLKEAIASAITAGIIAASGGVLAPLAPIIDFVVKAVMWVAQKTVGLITNGLQNIAQSIWGEKIKARDLLALPAVGLAGAGAIIAGLGTATVAAASSAGTTIALSAVAGVFLYLTAFTIAPLISTIAHLESQPGLEQVIGPISPGCPSIWPIDTTSTVYITQGPKSPASHRVIEAIDIGADPGVKIYSAHPGKATTGYTSIYGNYVDVAGICKGISFVTRYSHMPSIPFPGERLVNTGDTIGVVDNTGVSGGHHLHYEIRGGVLGDINQFLPRPVIRGCVGRTECGPMYLP